MINEKKQRYWTLKELAEQAKARWGKPSGYGPYGYYWIMDNGLIGGCPFRLIYSLLGKVELIMLEPGKSIDVTNMYRIEQVLDGVAGKYRDMYDLQDLKKCLVRLGMCM